MWKSIVSLLVGAAAMSALIGLNHVPYSPLNYGLAASAAFGLTLFGVFARRG